MKQIIRLLAVLLSMTVTTGCGSSMQGVGKQEVPRSSAVADGDYVIPEAFFGCWEGSLERFDSVTPLSLVGHLISESDAAHTTYQFCFRRLPGGTGRLDLTKVELAGNPATITAFHNQITALDSKRLMIRLHNHTVSESVGYLFWIIPIHAQQELDADEAVTMKSRDLLFVEGQQLLQIDGNDVAIINFHTDFHRVVEASPEGSGEGT